MSKIEEANAHIRQAEKCLKTTMLKWKPDFDTAADEYTAAATCFRVIKNYPQCKDCLIKASDCYKQNRAWFHAAKNLEQCVLILKEMNQLPEIPQTAHKACSLYQQHGSPESGANVLDKAGKLLEQTHPEQALELYRRAADIVHGEDSPRQAAEFMSKVARILVRLGMYDQAADAIRREMGMHQQIDHQPSIGRLTVALVLVQLARGDQVAAEKAFKEWGNYCDAPEVQTLEMLLQAYDNEDADVARHALNSPFIKHMDVEYAKLARSLALPQQEYAVPPAGVRANAAPSYVSPNTYSSSSQATVKAEVNDESSSSSTTFAAKKEEPSNPVTPEDEPDQFTSRFDSEEEKQPTDPSPPSAQPPVSEETKAPADEEDDDYEGGLC